MGNIAHFTQLLLRGVVYLCHYVFPVEFLKPKDVAVCPATARIVVADYGNHRIQVMDANFNHLMDITEDGQGRVLQYPAHVAVNSAGEIIVSDYYTRSVLVYDQSGSYSRDLLKGSWNKPGGIVVDKDDTIYIVDGRTRTIKVIDKAGQELRTILYGTRSIMNRLAVYLYSCIAIHRNQLVVCDTKGQLYQVDKMGLSFTKLYHVASARGLAVDHSGDLVIVDDEEPVTVIRDGIVVRHVGEHGGKLWKLRDPCGVAVTKSGEIVVVNFSKGNLLVYGH